MRAADENFIRQQNRSAIIAAGRFLCRKENIVTIAEDA